MKKKLVECSLGVRCLEGTARYVDQIAKALPKEKAYEYRRKAVLARPEVQQGERADVSFITTEDVDREREKMIAAGIDLSQYLLNPVVLYDHAYDRPVGRSAWIKPKGNGLIAKTMYAGRPDNLPQEQEWFPDTVLAMVQQGVLIGKSIGFLPLEVRLATAEETKQGAEVCIEKSLLLEYSCCTVPCCPTALCQAVSKGMKLPWKIEVVQAKARPRARPEDLLAEQLQVSFDPREIAELALNRLKGRV